MSKIRRNHAPCNIGRFLRLKACKMSRGLFGWPRERSLFEPETIPM